MTESPNFWAVYDRLMAAEDLDGDVSTLVEAAITSDAALDQVLSGGDAPTKPPTAKPEVEPDPPAAFLRSIEVERFRGIGEKAKLDLNPGPGLTLVVGRNGSGKSSFAEGLEFLLTGKSLRWEGRTAAWTSGWRNLHDKGPVELKAELSVEGRGKVSMNHRWDASGKLDSGTLTIREDAKPLAGLSELGWDKAVAAYRPFLSYNELSRSLDSGPSKLFDAFKGLLGLGDVADATNRLAAARKLVEKRKKDSTAARKVLVHDLGAIDDPRARAVEKAFSARKTNLDLLETLVLTNDEAADDGTVAGLRRLSTMRPPADTEVIEKAASIRAAVGRQAALSESNAARDHETALLLVQAVKWFSKVEAATCPLCKTPDILGSEWAAEAQTRAASLETSAKEARRAAADVKSSVAAVRQMIRATSTPQSVNGVDVEKAAQARSAWGEAPDDPLLLAEHIEANHALLANAYKSLRQNAEKRLGLLQLEWLPVHRRVAAWLESARRVEAENAHFKRLKAAETWLKGAGVALRQEAFAPIEDQAQATWKLLRQQSNVELASIELKGSATRRKVELNVMVDGESSGALGVMSQGELHALALSLFLPRLTRADSPFRFLIIDDPVQAMDPAKVDGLARVLEAAARTHQVVVFTHDGRLPTATRRLGIEAQELEVVRSLNSHVDVRRVSDPVAQHIDDARHVLRQRSTLSIELVRTVVPGLCRAAVEAALAERIWRDQLADGKTHADIEIAIAAIHGTKDLAAFALFGTTSRRAELLGYLNNKGSWAADSLVQITKFAHKPLPPEIEVDQFIRNAERLADRVRR